MGNWLDPFKKTPAITALSIEDVDRISNVGYDTLEDADKEVVTRAMAQSVGMGVWDKPEGLVDNLLRLVSRRSDDPEKAGFAGDMVSDQEVLGDMQVEYTSDKKWGDINVDDFTVEQFRDSALIDTGEGEGIDRYLLPVYEPNGKLNAEAMGFAATVLTGGALTGVDYPGRLAELTDEIRGNAAIRLARLYSNVEITPPDALVSLAGVRYEEILHEFDDIEEEVERHVAQTTEEAVDNTAPVMTVNLAEGAATLDADVLKDIMIKAMREAQAEKTLDARTLATAIHDAITADMSSTVGSDSKTKVSDKAWSEFKDSDFTDEQYAKATVLDRGAEAGAAKIRYGLPIHEPDGTLNRNAVHAAASMIGQVKGATDEQVRTAARKLLTAYGAIGEDAPDGLKKLANADLSRNDTEGATEMSSDKGMVRYLLPVDMSAASAVEKASNLWRKRILPFGEVSYKGRKLNFNAEMAKQIIDNFNRSAFDQVVFNLVDGKNSHNDDPERVRGEVEVMTIGEDGLYADVRTDERGTALLSANPKLGVSPRFIPDFIREHDGMRFGPTIQHIAGTVDPHVSGLGPWTAVEMSRDANADAAAGVTDNDTIVDMSGAEYVQISGEESIVDKDDQESRETDSDSGEVQGGEEVDMDIQARLEELSRDNAAMREQVVEMQRQRAENALDNYLEKEFIGNGVPPKSVEAAKAMLMPTLMGDNSPVEMSRDGSATLNSENPIFTMLEHQKGLIEFGRRGVVGVQEKSDTEAAQAKHDADYEAYCRQVKAD